MAASAMPGVSRLLLSTEKEAGWMEVGWGQSRQTPPCIPDVFLSSFSPHSPSGEGRTGDRRTFSSPHSLTSGLTTRA